MLDFDPHAVQVHKMKFDFGFYYRLYVYYRSTVKTSVILLAAES